MNGRYLSPRLLGTGHRLDAFRSRSAEQAELGDEIGCRALLVHAESSEAADFYRHLVPEFAESPIDPLHLVLLVKDVRRTVRGR